VVTFGIGAAVFNDCEASSKNLLIIIVHSFLYEKQDDFLEGKSLSKLIFFDAAIDHILR
jgi:hypothetical protein